ACPRSGRSSWRCPLSRLPGGLAHAGDHPVAGEPAEADAADAELAVDGPGPAADLAAAGGRGPIAARPQSGPGPAGGRVSSVRPGGLPWPPVAGGAWLLWRW